MMGSCSLYIYSAYIYIVLLGKQQKIDVLSISTKALGHRTVPHHQFSASFGTRLHRQIEYKKGFIDYQRLKGALF